MAAAGADPASKKEQQHVAVFSSQAPVHETGSGHNGGPRRFSVYVVELGKFPAWDGRTVLYAGSTSMTPEERFQKHLAGGLVSSPWVRRYGTRLRRDLVPAGSTYDERPAAERAEHELRLALEARGFRVFGGSGRPMPRR